MNGRKGRAFTLAELQESYRTFSTFCAGRHVIIKKKVPIIDNFFLKCGDRMAMTLVDSGLEGTAGSNPGADSNAPYRPSQA